MQHKHRFDGCMTIINTVGLSGPPLTLMQYINHYNFLSYISDHCVILQAPSCAYNRTEWASRPAADCSLPLIISTQPQLFFLIKLELMQYNSVSVFTVAESVMRTVMFLFISTSVLCLPCCTIMFLH